MVSLILSRHCHHPPISPTAVQQTQERASAVPVQWSGGQGPKARIEKGSHFALCP